MNLPVLLPNLILADSSSRILSIYYLNALSERGTRASMPGLPYILPEKKFMQPLGATSPVAEYHGENISASSPNNEADIYYQRLGAQIICSASNRVIFKYPA